MEHAARREERGLDGKPSSWVLRHVEIPVAPRDLHERRLWDITHLGPNRRVHVTSTYDDRGVPAVIDDPGGAGGFAARRLSVGHRRQAAGGQRDRWEECGDANH